MVIANVVNYEKTRFHAGIGSYCVMEYKKCIKNYEYNSCLNPLYNCGSISSDNHGIFYFPDKTKFLKEEKTFFRIERRSFNSATR